MCVNYCHSELTREVAKETVGTNPQWWWHTLNKNLFSQWSVQAHLNLNIFTLV